MLLSIPLDRAAFFAGLDDPARDYVRQFRLKRPNQTGESLWKAYRPYAELAADVCERVEKHNVRVVQSATLDALHAGIQTALVTTLVAHWRSALFRPEDIASPDQIAAYLQADASRQGNAELALRLNSMLKSADPRFDDVLPGSDGEAAARQRKWYIRRRELEPVLGVALRGGAAVEFADGFYSVREILAGFPVQFTGVLDLTVCQSALLAEEVRAKCRRCLVLCNVDLTEIDFRLALYAQVIDVLAVKPQPFEDAVIKVRRSLVKRYAKKQPTRYRSALGS